MDSDFHSVFSIQLCELMDAGFCDSEFTGWEWPCYSEEQDRRLRKKISDHYFFREISLVPPGIWKHEFIRKMNEIMPKYIPLYRLMDETPELSKCAIIKLSDSKSTPLIVVVYGSIGGIKLEIHLAIPFDQRISSIYPRIKADVPKSNLRYPPKLNLFPKFRKWRVMKEQKNKIYVRIAFGSI